MKSLFLLIFILFGNNIAFAQKTTKSIKVSGNCDQCKERIEQALDVKGVQSANWNTKTSILQVKYDSTKVSYAEVNTIIANSGHDTETSKASDKSYAALPDCCRYRESAKKH